MSWKRAELILAHSALFLPGAFPPGFLFPGFRARRGNPLNRWTMIKLRWWILRDWPKANRRGANEAKTAILRLLQEALQPVGPRALLLERVQAKSLARTQEAKGRFGFPKRG
jgi:hypothetical protein